MPPSKKPPINHKPQQHSSDPFVDVTMSKLADVHPISKNDVLVRNIGLGACMLLLSFCVSWLFSSYLYDVFFTLAPEPGSVNNLFLIADSLFEYVLIGVILIVLMYMLYRQTDWPLVRHNGVLLLLLVVAVGFGGGVLATYAGSEFLEKPNELLYQLPHRQGRKKRVQIKLYERGVVIGKVDSINARRDELIVRGDLGIVELKTSSENPLSEEINVDDVVIVRFERQEDALVVIRIEEKPEGPLRNGRPRRLLRRPMSR